MSAEVGAGYPAGPGNGLLKMSELAQRSGVPAATIKYYLREGVLGPDEGVVRTSRNMAYYPPEFVERIQLVKRLQEERYMPLKVIKELIASSPELTARLIEVEDRIVQRANEATERSRMSRKAVRETYEIPQNVLDRLEEIGVLSPTSRGYDRDDVKIIEAISRFRAGGYEQSLGFTVYDTLRYKEAFAPLVAEEVDTLVTRVAAQVPTERALEIIESADGPLQDLIGAMHSKMLLAELRQRRSQRPATAGSAGKASPRS
jgi:DNA-binding transcriptional MerR regulator